MAFVSTSATLVAHKPSSERALIRRFSSRRIDEIITEYEKIKATKIDYDLIAKLVSKECNIIKSNPNYGKAQLIKYMIFMSIGSFDIPKHIEFIISYFQKTDSYDVVEMTEAICKNFSVDVKEKNKTIIWLIETINRLDKNLDSIKDIATVDHHDTLFKVFRVNLGVTIYAMVHLPKEQFKKDFFGITQLGIYYGMSYIIDNIIDDDSVDDETSIALDGLIIDIIKNKSIVPDQSNKILQLAKIYLSEFSDLISSHKFESELRNILSDFHIAQRSDKISFDSECNLDKIYYNNARKSYYTRQIIPFLLDIEQPDGQSLKFAANSLLFQLYDDLRDFLVDRETKNFTSLTYLESIGSTPDDCVNPIDMILKNITYIINNNSYNKFNRGLRIVLRFLIVLNATDLSLVEEKTGINNKFVREIYDCIKELSPAPEFNMLEFDNIITRKVKERKDIYSTAIIDHKKMMEKTYIKQINISYPIGESMMYALEGGKCARSYFAKLILNDFGISEDVGLPFMVAMEEAQTASIIFDDLPAQDNAMTRRGKESVHVVYPEYHAQLTGVALIVSPFKHISELKIPSAQIVALTNYIARMMGYIGMCHGQYLDLKESCETIDDFIEMYRLKTSYGFRIPFVGSAIIANKIHLVPVMESISDHLGIAFQIRDDFIESTDESKKSTREAKKISSDDIKDIFMFHRNKAISLIFDTFSTRTATTIANLLISKLSIDV